MENTINKPAQNNQKTLEQIALDRYTEMAFANLKKNIIQDLINNRNESVIYKKYPKERVVQMLENPQKQEKALREMSNFLYIVSSHYRRLINYYAKLPKFNYTVIPTNLPSKIKKIEFRNTYNTVCYLLKKYKYPYYLVFYQKCFYIQKNLLSLINTCVIIYQNRCYYQQYI